MSDTKVTSMHMAMLFSSTITPTVAIGPASAGSHVHVVDGVCSSARGTARHESQNALPTAATMKVMDVVAAATAERRSGRTRARSRKLASGSASTSSATMDEPTFMLIRRTGGPD